MPKPTVYPTGKLENAIEDITWYAQNYAEGKYGLTKEEAEFFITWLILPGKWKSDEYEDNQLPIMESLKSKGFVTFEE